MLDTGSLSWAVTATAFVLLMTPGLAFFYGGFTLLNLSDAEDAEAADDGGPARLPAPNRSPHRRPSMTTSR